MKVIKTVSGIIMLIGAFITINELMSSESAPQQAASVVYVVGAYITGRALENFAYTSSNNKYFKKDVSEENNK